MPQQIEPIKLQARELAKAITLDVEIVGFKSWIIRLRMAVALIRLAAWIAGVGIVINERTQAETIGEEETRRQPR